MVTRKNRKRRLSAVLKRYFYSLTPGSEFFANGFKHTFDSLHVTDRSKHRTTIRIRTRGGILIPMHCVQVPSSFVVNKGEKASKTQRKLYNRLVIPGQPFMTKDGRMHQYKTSTVIGEEDAIISSTGEIVKVIELKQPAYRNSGKVMPMNATRILERPKPVLSEDLYDIYGVKLHKDGSSKLFRVAKKINVKNVEAWATKRRPMRAIARDGSGTIEIAQLAA